MRQPMFCPSSRLRRYLNFVWMFFVWQSVGDFEIVQFTNRDKKVEIVGIEPVTR